MALTDENGSMVMPVAPMGGFGGGFGGNNNGFGDGGWWILLLFILLAGGNGWGNNNNGGGNGGGFGGGFFPYAAATTDYAVQNGFDQAAIRDGITGVQNAVTSGFSDVQMALCNGFAGVANGFSQAEIANNARQIANMQQAFASQTAVTAGLNDISSQLASCCCENRLATNDLKYTIATENCADRAAFADGIRDILVAQNAGVQRILDTMCQDKIDAKNEKIADLERQLTMADLRASQIAQTAQIQRGQVAEVDALYQRLKDCPVPAMPVYGSQPIFTCPSNNNGCGCGCNGSF